MSEENVEAVRAALGLFNAFMRGEVSRETVLLAVEEADPQFEFKFHEGRYMPDSPPETSGAAALIESWEQYRSALADVTWEPLEFIEASDDRVLVPIRATGRGRESDVPFEYQFSALWTIREGNVHNVEFFRYHAEALEAAGLSE